MDITAVTQKHNNTYIGWIEELPGVNSQADSLEQLYENLKEAFLMVVEANRTLAQASFEPSLVSKKVIHLQIPA